jgi:hypothetical protein
MWSYCDSELMHISAKRHSTAHSAYGKICAHATLFIATKWEAMWSSSTMEEGTGRSVVIQKPKWRRNLTSCKFIFMQEGLVAFVIRRRTCCSTNYDKCLELSQGAANWHRQGIIPGYTSNSFLSVTLPNSPIMSLMYSMRTRTGQSTSRNSSVHLV